MRNKKLRSITCAAVSVVMLASFAGCANNSAASSQASSAASSTATSSVDPASLTGSCNLWTWDTTEKTTVEAFNKVYPNVKVNIVSVGYDDYMNKIMTTVASGGDMGDLLCGEFNFRKRLFGLDVLDNLESAPYNVKQSDILGFALPLSTYNGHVVGLEEGVSPGAIAYKADLAKKYLGTDDPAALESQLKTWDDYVAAGKKIQTASNGKVFLFHAWADVQEILDCSGTDALTQNNKPTAYLLNTDPTNRYTILEKMLTGGCFDKAISAHYTPAMNSALADDNHIMINCAPWTSQFVIQPNDKTTGRWRLMTAPVSFNMGGTVMGVYKNSKNKAAAWAYLGWACYSKEGGEAMLATRGFMTGYKPLVDSHDYSKDTDKAFGTQNVAKIFFTQLVPNLKVGPLEVYSNQIKASFATAEATVINDKTNSVTLDKYKEIVSKELKNNCPDLDW